VSKFLVPGAAPRQQDEWAGNDVFSIANSGVFVPIISAASLEQWSFEKRTPTTCFSRWLAVLMALFVFYGIINSGFSALLLSQQREAHMYLCGTVVLSLTMPTFIHAFVIRQLFIKEPGDGKNQAFYQWMQEHQACLPMLFFLGVIRPDVLGTLLTSGAFDWSVFHCPLSMRSSRRLAVAGLTSNVLHDLPQLLVSIILLRDPEFNRVKAVSPSIMLLLATGMALSSAIALVYSLLSRLSADLLLRAMRYNRANIDARDEGDVDEMMMEYMTALMQHEDRQPLKPSGGEGLPRLIAPLVIDEIFETGSKVRGERMSTAADSMLLLHPIGDNQISTATLRTHDQIMRSDLDMQVDGGFARRFAGAAGESTVSGVVAAILGHCAFDKERGVTQVFTVQRDRWGRCDAAAEHAVAKLHSIISGRPVQVQSTRGRSTNAKVRRTPGTSSSLEADEGGTAIYHAQAQCSRGISSIDGFSTPLLQPHLEQSGTDSTHVSSSAHTSKTGSMREFSSHTSMTSNSIASKSARSAFHSAADTTSMSSFKTANEGSTASWNAGGGGGGGSTFDWASACSFSTAEEVEDVKEAEEGGGSGVRSPPRR
jgi:hypothetical protein